MNKQEIDLLNKMKDLVRKGKRHFKEREDRDFAEDLANLSLTEDEAWGHILTLNVNCYFIDPKPNYRKGNNVLLFKKMINKNMAYIKLQIENVNGEEVVCWSFHKDGE